MTYIFWTISRCYTVFASHLLLQYLIQGFETCKTVQTFRRLEHVHKGSRILIQDIMAELCVPEWHWYIDRYNITVILDMTIAWTSLHFRFVGSRSKKRVKVAVAILGKSSVTVPAPLYGHIFDRTLHIYDSICDKCAFQHCRSKVYFKKMLF